jgi:hypothetical protein
MVIIGCLEAMVSDPAPSVPEGQQRRKERVEAFSNALDKLIDAGFGMDDPALGFALWSGFKEIASNEAESEFVKSLAGFDSIRLAYSLQHAFKNDLSNFALGVRKSIKELPPLDRDNYSIETQLAKWLEEHFARWNIPFSTSETGLAGQLYNATMMLMSDGNHIAGAKYRLSQAANNPDSFANFIERMNRK